MKREFPQSRDSNAHASRSVGEHSWAQIIKIKTHMPTNQEK